MLLIFDCHIRVEQKEERVPGNLMLFFKIEESDGMHAATQLPTRVVEKPKEPK